MCAPAGGASIEVVMIWVNHDAGGVVAAPTLTRDTQYSCRATLSFSLTQIDNPLYQSILIELLRKECSAQILGVLFKRDRVVKLGTKDEESLRQDHDRTACLLGVLRREIGSPKIVVVSNICDLSPALAQAIDGRMTYEEFRLLRCSETYGSHEHRLGRSAA